MLLHIGFQKTGTTYLQAHVFTPAKGFCYPWTVNGAQAIEHFVLTHPRRFRPDEVRAAFDEAVRQAGGEGRVPVISHEDLSGYPVFGRYYGYEVGDRLLAAFPEGRVLIGVREQKAMIRSMYGQYVRQDGEWPLPEFLGPRYERPGFRPICRMDHFEYDLMVEFYRERFGPDRVLVLPLELLKRDPVGYEQRVHDFAGSAARAEAGRAPENVGHGAITAGFNRWLNRFAKRPPVWHPDERPASLAHRAKMKACKVLDSTIPKQWHRARETKLRAQVAERVGDYYRESNRRLASLIGVDLAALGYDT